jgi:hypothetical protein
MIELKSFGGVPNGYPFAPLVVGKAPCEDATCLVQNLPMVQEGAGTLPSLINLNQRLIAVDWLVQIAAWCVLLIDPVRSISIRSTRSRIYRFSFWYVLKLKEIK